MNNLILDKQYRDKCRKNILSVIDNSKEIFCFYLEAKDILVSNYGNLKKASTGEILKPHKNRNGYDCLNVRYLNGKRMSTLVHRIVANTYLKFFDNDNYVFEVNHIDGNKSNNYVTNLEWLTRGENLQHARDNKLFKSLKGEKSPRCKFSRQDCKDMIELHQSGIKIIEISRLYNADRNTVSKIVRGKARIDE